MNILASKKKALHNLKEGERQVLVSFAQRPIYMTYTQLIRANQNISGSYINKGDEARVLNKYGNKNTYEIVNVEIIEKEFNEFKINCNL